MSRVFALISVLLVLAATPAFGGLKIGDAPAPPQCHDFLDNARRMHSVCIGEARFFDDVCLAIATFAWAYDLPPGLFARLIWLKSRHLPDNEANASGMAQFLPGDADDAVLRGNFLPAAALAFSANRLSSLRDRFGNLGLAAAAYLSGEAVVARWSLQQADLPQRTQDYVQQVTGISVETWRDTPSSNIQEPFDATRPFHPDCVGLARANPVPVLTAVYGRWMPWGVLIAQHFTASIALAQFDRVVASFDTLLRDEPALILTVQNRNFGTKRRHSVMIGRSTREDAEALCAQLRQAGGNCVVVRN